jgi:site-specific DNA recombinase
MNAVDRLERAALYLRVSTARQESGGTSLETQEAACRAFAADRGYRVVAAFSDVYTGEDVFNRPGMANLWALLRARGTDMVIAYALDRLSRNQTHQGLILSEIEHAGARLELVTEKLEDTPEGRLLLSVRGFVAEVERLKISERTNRGRRKRAQDGKMMPGPRPLYGYRWRDATRAALEINPETAPVLQRIFRELAGGKSMRQVAKGLTQDGIPSPTGAPMWTASSLTYLIRQETYTGIARAFRTKQQRGTDGKYRQPAASEDHQIALPVGTVPALIDAATFAAIQARLARNKAEATRNNPTPEDALLRSGYAICGYCGNNLAALRHTRSGKRNYICTSTVRERHGHRDFGMLATKLDPLIWDWVKERVSDPGIIRAELERQRQENPHGAELAAVNRRISGITVQQARLTRSVAILDDEDAAAPLLVELRSLAIQRRALEAEREHLKAERDDWETLQARLDAIAEQCETVRANLDTLDYQGKRDLLYAFNVKVKVWATDHTPRFEATMQPKGILYGRSSLWRRRRPRAIAGWRGSSD